MWQLLLKDNGAKQLFKDAVGPNEGRFDCSKKWIQKIIQHIWETLV